MAKAVSLSKYCLDKWGIPQNTVKWQAPILVVWKATENLNWEELQVYTNSYLPGKIYMNKLMTAAWTKVVKELICRGLLSIIKTIGCFNIRRIAGSTQWSTHAYGISFDINDFENKQGKEGKIDLELVSVFEKHGFTWGGRWKGKTMDPMHFEFDPRNIR